MKHGRLTVGIAAIIAFAGLPVAATAWAQPTPGSTAPAAPQGTVDRTARELSRMAMLDLQLTNGSNPRDYRIAAILMEIAHELTPDNEELLRYLIDATSSAGDPVKLLKLTEELVKLNPTDTVSQLRLISGRISSLQDADARLAVYDNFLGPKGKGLDASIRSRLALDAALLLRERGDLKGFADKLALATELDSTNKDAASLALTFYSAQSADAVGRLALLVNLLKADPGDPETHLAIARELAAGDAFKQSSRFYATYEKLLNLRGVSMAAPITAESQTVFWDQEGAEQLITKSRETVEQERSRADVMRRVALMRDLPIQGMPTADSVRLTPDLERVRAAAALAIGDAPQIDYCFGELTETFKQNLDGLADRSTLPASMTQEEIERRKETLQGELLWMRLWCGKELKLAEDSITEASAQEGVNPDVLARFKGWLQLQKGDLDGAERTLTPLAETDLLAKLGLVTIQERRGALAESAKGLAGLAQESAGSMVGAYARTRYLKLTGKPMAVGPYAAQMDAMASGVPGWLEEMIANPRRMMSLQVAVEPVDSTPLEPLFVRVRMRNVSPIPLAVGPDKPMNSQILMSPRLDVGLMPVAKASAGAAVVRLDRRLRLLPQEEIAVRVWATAGNFGWILNHMMNSPSTIRWKAIQGFQYDEKGQFYREGPMCLAAETQVARRTGGLKAWDSGTAMVKWIESGSPEDLAESLMLMQISIQLDERSPVAWKPEEKDAIAQALAKRYPTFPPVTRLMVASMMPLKGQTPWLAPVDDVIGADTDVSVRAAVMALRLKDAADPRLEPSATKDDARLAELAVLVKQRLTEGTRCFAVTGMDDDKKGAKPVVPVSEKDAETKPADAPKPAETPKPADQNK